MDWRPSRLVAIALALVLMGAGVVALSQWAGKFEPTDEPFAVPPLREGDLARYEDQEGQELLVEVRSPTGFRNQTVELEADVIAVQSDGYPDLRLHLVEPETGRSLAIRENHEHSSTRPEPLGLPLGMGGSSASSSQATLLSDGLGEYGLPLQPCGIRNPFQFGPRSLHEVPEYHCGLGMGRWSAVAETTDDAGRAVLFEVRSDEWGRLGMVTLRDDVSMPVQIIGSRTWNLTGFTPGDGPTARGGAEASSLPPMQLVSRTKWMLDDDGIGHPFPLSVAYQAVLDHADGELRDFMARHPDAYLSSAQLSTEYTQTSSSLTWEFETASPNASVSSSASLYEARLGPLGLFEFVEVRVDEPQTGEIRLPSKSALPDDLPRVNDLYARYSAFLNGEPQTYQFMVRCGHDGCHEAFVRIEVGVSHSIREPATDEGLDVYEHENRFLIMDGSGTPLWYYESSGEIRMFSSPLPQVHGTSLSAAGPPSPFLLAVSPIVGWTALGVGASALLALLVKGWLSGAFFTRLDRDRLLEHPVRARIHEAVCAEPGIHYQELVRRLDIPQGTLRHHLTALTRGEVLKGVKGPRHKSYFAAGATDRHTMAAAPYLRSEGARRVLQCVREYPGRSTSELARLVGLSPSTVHLHLFRLEQTGIMGGGLSAKEAWWIMRPEVLGVTSEPIPKTCKVQAERKKGEKKERELGRPSLFKAG